jgi:DUF4097 and DUF4098 domain-containing protein YvlB
MRNIASIAILAACIAVTATAQTSLIQPTGPSPAKETKTFALQSNGNLKISNLNGGITITAHDKDEVTLTATFKPSRRNNEYPRIEVDSKKNYLELVVKYPKEKNEVGSCEMELFVPRRINSKISTVNGGIALNEINGSHKIRTVNGGISFDIATGKVEASTVNGVIVAIQKNEGNVEASTVNGGIILTLSDPNTTLNASNANGVLMFKAPGAKEVSKKNHSVSATFGNGNAKIKLRTVNGVIVIR